MPNRPNFRLRPSVPLVLLILFLATLWLAGGASRADVLGQAVVRGTAWALLIIGILFGPRPDFGGVRPVLVLLVASLALLLLQLLPLPPNLWLALPARAAFSEAAAAMGSDQPWRPLAIVPSAAVNAASSLIVPFTTLFLAVGLHKRERRLLPGVILGFVTASTLLGLLQFSGSRFDNPLINDLRGQVSGPFANRNHFALLLALGCLLVPVWVFLDRSKLQWRIPVALGLLLLLFLTILATGSRAGLILATLALGCSTVLVWKGIRTTLRRAPRWAFPALVVSVIGGIAIAVLVSVAADRAVSITRVIALDPTQGMRSLALPTVLEMIYDYFPFGTGFGGFDEIFRMHEPFELLRLRYFNNAHNDFLEIVLDGGFPGLILLTGGISWWAIASFRAWRTQNELARVGAAMILLILVASAFDYPARTPIIMAMVVVAGVWLCSGERRGGAHVSFTDE